MAVDIARRSMGKSAPPCDGRGTESKKVESSADVAETTFITLGFVTTSSAQTTSLTVGARWRVCGDAMLSTSCVVALAPAGYRGARATVAAAASGAGGAGGVQREAAARRLRRDDRPPQLQGRRAPELLRREEHEERAHRGEERPMHR